MLALLSLAILAVLDVGGLFTLTDLKLRDLWFQLRGERKASEKIAVIEVDDATIAAYGGWPLSRDVYALLLVVLEDAGAQAVGFDLLFLGPDQHDERYDALLSEVTSIYPNIVHGVAFFSDAPAVGSDASIPEGETRLASRHGLDAASLIVPYAASVRLPYEELVEATPAIGHTTVSVDIDGTVRRLPPFIRHQDAVYPALGLRLAWFAEGEGDIQQIQGEGNPAVLVSNDGRRTEMHLDDEGSIPIDFAGGAGAFPDRHGMLDVLHWYRQGDLNRIEDTFSGRIVIVGNTTVGEAMADMGTTPFATLTPLVYAHANFLDMVLRGSFFGFAPQYVSLMVLILLAIMLGFLFTRFSLPVAAIIMGGVVLCVAVAEYLLFAFAHLIVPGTMPLVLAPLSYGLIASYRYIFMERRVSEHEKELKVARTIQMELLPAGPPSVSNLDVFGMNLPAKSVAGDYFDWIELPSGSLAVAVGDVSGKGVSSSLLMSHIRASLHAEIRGSEDPRDIVEAMNISLTRAIEAHHFATFFLAVVSTEKHMITYCNAGHSPVLLVSKGKIERLERTGLPLGIFEDTPYTGETKPFAPGDQLVICTDGVTEAQHHGELYGDERLDALVTSLAPRNLSAKEFGEVILTDVRSFTRHEEYDDDLTIVVVRDIS